MSASVQEGVKHPYQNLSFPEPGENICNGSCTKKGSFHGDSSCETSRETFSNDNDNHSCIQEHHRLARESSRYKHTITVNLRYLADSVQKAFDSGHNHLALLSDMGSGKSWMLINLIASQPEIEVSIVVTPLASLCQGNANRFSKNNLIAVNYSALTPDMAAICQVVTTTYNTLPTVEKLLMDAGRKINIVALDESEAGAQFLASGTIDNKAETGEVLKRLISVCNHSLLMDAHLDLGSNLLSSVFSEQEYTLLANTYQVWSGHTYSWHDGREAGLSVIVDLIDSGKNVFISATTAGQAKKIHMALERLGILSGLKVLAAYPSDNDSDSEELRKAKDNPDLFATYPIVIASPTVGIGISIDDEWFDSVVSFFVRDKDAPSALGAMQMPFRVRNIKDKHIHLVKVDQIDRGRKLSEWQIRQDKKAYDTMLKIMDEHSFDDADKATMFSQLASLHGGFETRLDIHDSVMFDDYYSLIDQEFSDKGIIQVAPCPVAEMDKPFQGLNREIKEKHNIDMLAAPVVSPAECAGIEQRIKHNPRSVTASEKMAVKKHHLVSAYHDSVDSQPDDDQLLEYIKAGEKGIATGRNNIAKAALSLVEINQIQKHYRNSRDAADKKAAYIKEHWKLDKILLNISGVSFSCNAYSVAEKVIDAEMLTTKKKGHSVIRKLSVIANSYNATKPEGRISLKLLRENPCAAIKKLIESRLKLRCKFVLGAKAREVTGNYSFIVQSDQPAIDNLNMMLRTRGTFGDLRVLSGLIVDDLLSGNQAGNDAEVKAHVVRQFAKIPLQDHSAVMEEYLRRVELPREPGDNMTPMAKANTWLADCAEGAKYAT